MRRTVLTGVLTSALVVLGNVPGIAADKVTLTYMTSQGWILDAHTALYKKFEEETGIAIDAQVVPADQYYNVLKTKLNSGEVTGIFGGQSGVNTLQVDLNVEKNAVDLSGEPWAKKLDPLVASQATVNGKLYGLTYWDPLGLVWVVNYNKKVFADNGVSVPSTYAELKAACEKLKAAGVQPLYEAVADGWHHVLWFPEMGPTFEAANPGLAEKLNENKATFAGNKEMLTDLNQLKELYDSGFMGENALADANADAPAKLASGEIAMVLNPLAYAATVASEVPGSDPDNVGLFLIPLVDNKILNVNPGGPTMFISKNSPHIAEAKKFFEWLTQPEQLQFYIDTAPQVLTMPFEGVKSKFNPTQQAFMDKYKDTRGIVYQIAVNYINSQWMEIGKDITAMFTGAMTAEQVLESVDKRRAEYAKAAKDPAWN